MTDTPVKDAAAHAAAARVADYEHGWSSDIEQEYGPKGLSEDTVRFISAKKNEPEWMLDWRLKAYRHWLTMTPPDWAKLNVPPIDYDQAYYWAAPKAKPKLGSLDEVDPEILRIYEKLGIPLEEQKVLAGVEGARKVAVDAVFDSVSVATTFRKELEEAGVIFRSISEAIREYPELVKKWLGKVVPMHDNYFATLNSAVFSDGTFVYIPEGVRCPMELSTYFRINAENTGQFERTLIVADKGSYVSYLEGCTAPQRDENQLARRRGRAGRARRCRDQIFDRAELVSRRRGRQGRHLQLRHQARMCQGRAKVLDAGGNRQRDHLEIPVCVLNGENSRGRVLLGRHHQQLPAGRHRHQDDPQRASGRARPSCPRASARGGAAAPIAGWCVWARGRRMSAISRNATAAAGRRNAARIPCPISR
jgi:Fe-S cluster assembly scaffold protein SufB